MFAHWQAARPQPQATVVTDRTPTFSTTRYEGSHSLKIDWIQTGLSSPDPAVFYDQAQIYPTVAGDWADGWRITFRFNCTQSGSDDGQRTPFFALPYLGVKASLVYGGDSSTTWKLYRRYETTTAVNVSTLNINTWYLGYIAFHRSAASVDVDGSTFSTAYFNPYIAGTTGILLGGFQLANIPSTDRTMLIDDVRMYHDRLGTQELWRLPLNNNYNLS
jgi:hypothetical protein